MNRSEPLTELEQFVLLALVRLGDEAYGVSIRRAIEERTERAVSITRGSSVRAAAEVCAAITGTAKTI